MFVVCTIFGLSTYMFIFFVLFFRVCLEQRFKAKVKWKIAGFYFLRSLCHCNQTNVRTIKTMCVSVSVNSKEDFTTS